MFSNIRVPPFDRNAIVNSVSEESNQIRRHTRLSSFNMLWTNLLVILLFLGKIIVADNLALLLGTLRTYQRTGCDHDVVMLKCPHGTTISVQLAQYGKVTTDQKPCLTGTTPVTLTKNTSCLLPHAVQTVVEACQKKRQCKFQSMPKILGADPCPGISKYIEVGYKCRPYEFRSKVACENDVVQLKCNPHSRIAIYSASFGRTEYESVQCPQPQGVPEETCLVSYATETVMQICHGKRSCTISADASTFGNPCRPASRMYLKVVYTCVPRKVLKERYEEPTLEDETTTSGSRDANDYDEFDGYESIDDFFRESAAFSPPPNADTSSTGNVTQTTTVAPQVKDQSAVTSPSRSCSPAGQKRYCIAFPSPVPSNSSETSPDGSDLTAPGVSHVLVKKKAGSVSLKGHSDRKPTHRVEPVMRESEIQMDTVIETSTVNGLVNCSITIYSNENSQVIGFISEWVNVYTFVKKNQEKLYLYLILSVTSGLLLVLAIIIVRLMVQKYRAVREAKFYATHNEHTITHGFGDENSEIEADINLAATSATIPNLSSMESSTYHGAPAPAADIVQFSEIRVERDNISAPRSFNRYGNSQYYFG